jgi:hypothetical protein
VTHDPHDDAAQGVRWWELAGHHDQPRLRAQWTHLARAVRAMAAIAAGPAGDAALTWIPGDRLPDQFFATPPAADARSLRAVLRPWDMRVFAVDPAGSPVGALELEGQSPERIPAWFGSLTAVRGEPLAGPGDPFPPTNQLAVAEIIRLYANTDALLGRISAALGASDPIVDGATLAAVLRLDGTVAGVRTIGLEPPGEGLDARWFVRGAAGEAYLTLAEVASSHDPSEQHASLSGFFAGALRP